MVEAHSINAEHKDLIHDVAFDYYGERMATCSTDQFVKVSIRIFNFNEFGCSDIPIIIMMKILVLGTMKYCLLLKNSLFLLYHES